MTAHLGYRRRWGHDDFNDVRHDGSPVSASAYDNISVSFDSDTNAYAAFTKLDELGSQGQLNIESATVVERGDGGKVVFNDSVGSGDFARAAGGGLLGPMSGIIGAPPGVLVGAHTGS